MRVAAIVVPVVLLSSAALGAAASLEAGMRMPALTLSDQHDTEGALSADTRYVLFSRDMTAAKVVNEALENDPAVLGTAHAVVVSDISGMPSLITKLFALPALRKRAYRILLDREGQMTADFPSEKGKVTVFRLHALTIERVEYVDAAAALRAMLHQAAERPTPERSGDNDGG